MSRGLLIACGVALSSFAARDALGADCVPREREQACAIFECDIVSDGCGGAIECGPCPEGEWCGLLEPYSCDPLEDPIAEPAPSAPDAGTDAPGPGDAGSEMQPDAGAIEPGDACVSLSCDDPRPACGGVPDGCAECSAAVDPICDASGDGCGGIVDCCPCPPGVSAPGKNEARDAGKSEPPHAPMPASQPTRGVAPTPSPDASAPAATHDETELAGKREPPRQSCACALPGQASPKAWLVPLLTLLLAVSRRAKSGRASLANVG